MDTPLSPLVLQAAPKCYGSFKRKEASKEALKGSPARTYINTPSKLKASVRAGLRRIYAFCC